MLGARSNINVITKDLECGAVRSSKAGQTMFFDGPLTAGTVQTRVLLSKMEAQLRYEVLPEGAERQTIREKIEMCELVLRTLESAYEEGIALQAERR